MKKWSTPYYNSGKKFFTLLFSILLGAFPILFNSCEKKQLTQQSDLSALYCPQTFSDSVQSKLSERPQSLTSPFQNQKLILSQSSQTANMGRQKIQAENLLEKGSKLTIFVDTQCVVPSKSRLSSQLYNSRPSPLKKEAYTYTLPQAMEALQLDKLLGEDPCIIGATEFQTYQTQATYNDPEKIYQGHLNKTYALKAHDFFYDPSIGIDPSENVVVAVIDAGVDYTHRDLNDNMWKNASNEYGFNAGRDNTKASCYPGGVLPDSNDPMDTSPISHGTHVAGLIAAETNNGIGIIGHAAKNVKIMAVNVFYYALDTGGDCLKDKEGNNLYVSDSTTVARGMQYAIENGADVINMSLGSVLSNPAADDVSYIEQIESALSHNITVVTVSGNHGYELSESNFMVVPAKYGQRYQGVITVGSVDTETSFLSNFSNRSKTYTEITAYGNSSYDNNGIPEGIYSTLSSPPLGSYGYLAGTSMAAPAVSAAAAMTIGMMRSHGLDPKPEIVESLIFESGVQNPGMTEYVKEGKILNFYNLGLRLQSCFPDTTTNH
ncbi:MAG: S8 family serine peptidase [Bdellovibrionales bacterium]|nr:S8 family serine peptidase [Bdellovibrionales bacterium]